MYDSIFNRFQSRNRDRDHALGDVSHRTDQARIIVHYHGAEILTISCRLGKKEGFLAKIKRALVKRRRPLHDPY